MSKLSNEIIKYSCDEIFAQNVYINVSKRQALSVKGLLQINGLQKHITQVDGHILYVD